MLSPCRSLLVGALAFAATAIGISAHLIPLA